jgi:anti-sigma regulatory factor (Ser/Thr protein kinase)
MAVDVHDIAIDSGSHAVHFYEDGSELAQTVGRYLSDAVRDGAVGLVIATQEHRRAFEAALGSAGIDPATACSDGVLIWLDAADTLARFMPEGRIDGDAFRRVVGSVVRRATDTGRPVRAFGEMVGLLWEAGQVLAALELEELWNDLGRELPFSLLCGYHSEAVLGEEHAAARQQVCHLHSSVLRSATCGDPEAPRAAGAPEAPRPVGAEVSAQFAADRAAPCSARHFVTDALARWGHAGAFLENAQLLVTELATNAVVHARSPFSVVARADASGVRLSVRDASRVRPTLRGDFPTATSGRGLRLVAALSANWGVDVTADGKTVWAELKRPDQLPAAAPAGG